MGVGADPWSDPFHSPWQDAAREGGPLQAPEAEGDRRAVSPRARSRRGDRRWDAHDAAIEATEEAIVNALLAAETMTGRDGIVAHALDAALLAGALRGQARG